MYWGEKEMAQCLWKLRKCGGRYCDRFKNYFFWYFLRNTKLKNLLMVSGHTNMPKNLDQGIRVSFLLRAHNLNSG
jgi:hypothetical protein